MTLKYSCFGFWLCMGGRCFAFQAKRRARSSAYDEIVCIPTNNLKIEKNTFMH